MQHISNESLDTLAGRVSYMASFLEVTNDDAAVLSAAKPLVAPLIPDILDKVYTKLLSYDITAAAFVPKNTDYEGETVKDVRELTLDNPQIAMRKDFLKNYLVKLFSASDFSSESPFWVYLDRVGQMHTGQPGFKHREKRPDLRVDYIHAGMLLGYVMDVVMEMVLGVPEETLPTAQKAAVLRSLNKIIWIQNELFAKWYMPSLPN